MSMFTDALKKANSAPQTDLTIDETSRSLRNFLPAQGAYNLISRTAKVGRNIAAGLAGRLFSTAEAAPVPAEIPLLSSHTAPYEPRTSFGAVGLNKLGPQDLSRLSTGALPGTAPPQAPSGSSIPTTKPLTPKPTGVAALRPAGERIYEYKVPGLPTTDQSQGQLLDELQGGDVPVSTGGIRPVSTGLTAQEIQAYNTDANGGIATNGDQTFVLPTRGVGEAAPDAAPSYTPSAVPPTTTYGDARGVSVLTAGQGTSGGGISMRELVNAKFAANLAAKQANIRNLDATTATHNETALTAQQDRGIKALKTPGELSKQTEEILTSKETRGIKALQAPLERELTKQQAAYYEKHGKVIEFPLTAEGKEMALADKIALIKAKGEEDRQTAEVKKIERQTEEEKKLAAAEVEQAKSDAVLTGKPVVEALARRRAGQVIEPQGGAPKLFGGDPKKQIWTGGAPRVAAVKVGNFSVSPR